MKKILLILFLSITTLILAQSKDQESTATRNKSIENLSAYPNPLITETKISFLSKSRTSAILKVKNLLGKTVYSKAFTIKKGENSITFYKNSLESGMYIYSLQTVSEIVSKRLVIK
jgi:hypothetical protein